MNIYHRLAKRLPLFLFLGAFLATSFTIQTAEAQEPVDGNCPLLTELVFVNGVRNTFAEANLSRGHTEDLYRREILTPGEILTSSVAYNSTSGPDQIIGPGHGLDFIQAISQIAAQYEISITDVLDIVRGLPLPARLALLPTTPIVEVVYQKFRLQDWLAEFTLNEHLQKYDKLVAEGKRVIIVAHSQGNLFANAAYRDLAPEIKPHVRVVGVATPANNVAGDSNKDTARYVTAHEDTVILFVPTSLPSNVPQGNRFGDFFAAHNYVEFYLRRGSNTRAEIRGLIEAASEQVPPPPDDCSPSPPPPLGDCTAVDFFNDPQWVGATIALKRFGHGVSESIAVLPVIFSGYMNWSGYDSAGPYSDQVTFENYYWNGSGAILPSWEACQIVASNGAKAWIPTKGAFQKRFTTWDNLSHHYISSFALSCDGNAVFEQQWNFQSWGITTSSYSENVMMSIVGSLTVAEYSGSGAGTYTPPPPQKSFSYADRWDGGSSATASAESLFRGTSQFSHGTGIAYYFAGDEFPAECVDSSHTKDKFVPSNQIPVAD